MQDYKKLEIYKRAKEISVEVYKITSKFPPQEIYGLTTQLRRAAVSVGANIAEGCGRDGRRDFLRFLYTSLGSLKEVEYQLELAHELKYLEKESYKNFEKQIMELGKMLFSFIKSVRTQLT